MRLTCTRKTGLKRFYSHIMRKIYTIIDKYNNRTYQYEMNQYYMYDFNHNRKERPIIYNFIVYVIYKEKERKIEFDAGVEYFPINVWEIWNRCDMQDIIIDIITNKNQNTIMFNMKNKNRMVRYACEYVTI